MPVSIYLHAARITHAWRDVTRWRRRSVSSSSSSSYPRYEWWRYISNPCCQPTMNRSALSPVLILSGGLFLHQMKLQLVERVRRLLFVRKSAFSKEAWHWGASWYENFQLKRVALHWIRYNFSLPTVFNIKVLAQHSNGECFLTVSYPLVGFDSRVVCPQKVLFFQCKYFEVVRTHENRSFEVGLDIFRPSATRNKPCWALKPRDLTERFCFPSSSCLFQQRTFCDFKFVLFNLTSAVLSSCVRGFHSRL